MRTEFLELSTLSVEVRIPYGRKLDGERPILDRTGFKGPYEAGQQERGCCFLLRFAISTDVR